jgi:hypothetical protein
MAEEKIDQLTLTPMLAAISAANPGLRLSASDVQAVVAGDLVLAPFFPGVPVPKGCITYLRFGESDEDLNYLELDGVPYPAANLKRFRETLLKAACCHMCINFCWNTRTKTITMLNLFPCSECRPNERCGCDND